MEDINRRVALTLGLAAAPGLAFGASAEEATPAEAPYAPDFGKEIAPGVRQVDLGVAPSKLSGYKTVSMRDLVFQPGANTFDPMTQSDMIGYITRGPDQAQAARKRGAREEGHWALDNPQRNEDGLSEPGSRRRRPADY